MDFLRVGIAGLGTVGVGVFKILTEEAEALSQRCGNKLKVSAVSSRDKNKDRGVNLADIKWFEDANELANSNEVDIFVELIGGSDGIAYNSVKTALEAKKHVVTANKALIAKHGFELAKLAEANSVRLLFEAAVAGGIPIIKTIKESLAGNEINKVSGILNGTCNYILTEMANKGSAFDAVLKDAQELGYAEADPSFDIDGVDTAHKLVILTSLAFDIKPSLDDIYIDGVRNISQKDIKYAKNLGYNIRLLGICRKLESGKIEQFVYPCMVSDKSDIGQVEGVLGAVKLDCSALGDFFQAGAGAGMMPTASSVLGDLCDISWGRNSNIFRVNSSELSDGEFLDISQHEGEYFVRICVNDVDGVLSSISQILAKHSIGIEQIHQNMPENKQTDIIFLTHKEVESDVFEALAEISKQKYVSEEPVIIRCEKS